MKKYLLLFLVVPIFYSCKDFQILALQKRVSELEQRNLFLEQKNEELLYEIEYMNELEKDLTGFTMIGIPDQNRYQVNEPVEIKYGLFKTSIGQKCNIYRYLGDFKEKELIEENWSKANYHYKYVPSSRKENQIHLEFEYGDGEYKTSLMSFITLEITE